MSVCGQSKSYFLLCLLFRFTFLGPSIFSIYYGKAFAFRTAVEVVFFLWVFLAIFYEEYRPRQLPIVLAVLAWILIITAATIFCCHSNARVLVFERMEGLITYLHLAAYFLVLTHVFRKNDWLVLFNIFLVSGFLKIFMLFYKNLAT